MYSLDKMEETLIRGRIGLIVLDSVASVIRAEFHGDGEDSSKLSTGLSRIAATLKYLADAFRIPVSLFLVLDYRYCRLSLVCMPGDLSNMCLLSYV